jgi:SAM-dependent methyltransferase
VTHPLDGWRARRPGWLDHAPNTMEAMADPSAPDAWEAVREAVLGGDFVSATASGRRRGAFSRWRRVELRPVDLTAGRHVQVTAYDQTQAFTTNHRLGDEARQALDELLVEPFGSWSVTTTTGRLSVEVTRKGQAILHRHRADGKAQPVTSHDKPKQRLLDPSAPYLREIGISDAEGRVKPSRQAKYRQVEEFCRQLTEALDAASSRLPELSATRPLRVVDLGCGNAYLTFAAHHVLTQVRELPVDMVGIDVKAQARQRNTAIAERLGWSSSLRFVQGEIAGPLDGELRDPDVVLALHACDTATDDALARAVAWEATLVLSAPCCHHDLQTRLASAPVPEAFTMVSRHGILRERLADTLTDAVRASLLRTRGYTVDVREFVGSEHTPRNTLLRAIRTDDDVSGATGRREVDGFVRTWGVRPRLAELL